MAEALWIQDTDDNQEYVNSWRMTGRRCGKLWADAETDERWKPL